MGNYTATASVALNVNGKQAAMVLDQMKKKADALSKAIEKEKLSPNPDLKKLRDMQKELRDCNKVIGQMTPSAKSVEKVLRNLDKASPKELKKTLSQLQRQLEGLQRGTAAWDAHVAKIKAVKKEISELNKSMAPEKSIGERIKGTFDNWAGAVATATAAITGLIAAGKAAVEAYAEMDQEMANVRKFTGMTAEQVESLNGEFKKIDTRTSREELNKLAQEAGRLGKQSPEEVLGFVRAADKVNVALDDLGDGATLELSKLAGIFGDEKRLGTEKALLSIGSVINELSQNCAASAPYISQFASRMGGVGAQAGLTVPQIMAFGAVLDSNSQALEASSTAVSQVMVRLYQEPAKYAKVAGMDVKAFTNLVKTDMNAAFISFLETLNKAGGMDTLSPMFKDMGENGSRAIAALSTLATHIDDVKNQQQEASKAFQEAISIDKEFEVQNTTVQASLDKAKNGFREMAVTLGQKLQPVMRHAISSTSILMRVMSEIVSFVAGNIKAILSLAAVIGVYTIAANLAAIKTKALALWQGTCTLATKAMTAANHLGAASVALLSGNIAKARIEFALFSKTLMANPLGLVAAAVAGLVVWLISLRKETDEYTKSVREAIEGIGEFEAKSTEEISTLDKLFAVLRVGHKETERYKNAKEQVISQYGRYLRGLIDEHGEITNLSLAYDRLTAAVQRSARERGIAAAREKITEEYFNSSGDIVSGIEKSMRQYGASQEEMIIVGDAVSKMMATGNPIGKEARNIINKYSKAPIVPKYDENGQKIGSWAKAWNTTKVFFAGEHALPDKPLAFLEKAEKQVKTNTQATASLDAMSRALNPFPDVPTETLLDLEKELQEVYDSKTQKKMRLPESLSSLVNVTDGRKNSVTLPGYDIEATVVPSQAEAALEQIRREIAYRGVAGSEEGQEERTPGNGYVSQKKTGKGSGSDKVMQQVKKELKAIKGEYEKAQAEIVAMRSRGEISYDDMITRRREAEEKFYADSLEVFRKHGRTESEEYASMLLKRNEANERFRKEEIVRSREVEDRIFKINEAELKAEYAEREKSMQNEMALQEELLSLRLHHLDKVRSLYGKESEEYMKITKEREQLLLDDMYSRQEKYQKKVAELRKKYAKQDPAHRVAEYKADLDLIEYLREQDAISEEDAELASAQIRKKASSDILSRDEMRKALREYEDRKAELKAALESGMISSDDYRKESAGNESAKRHSLADRFDSGGEWMKATKDVYVAWADMIDAICAKSDDIPAKVGAAIQATAAIINAGMQVATEFVAAETQIQEARIRKRYDREIEYAEGNAYLVRQLEKKRDRELAKLKDEQAKKQFAMQIIQTVAQTAQNAVAAYHAGLAVGGPAGLILAPIAAAMAVAQGAVQIALLKKQQQAAAAQGYSEGGFTKPGRKDEPAGIVHAGEWVASQKLVNNPRTRPMIEALEYMQRHNSIGRLDSEDVTRSISALRNPSVVVMREETREQTSDSVTLSRAIDRLNDRLERPFVTVNSVTGQHGMKQAYDLYDKLIDNASR